MPTRIYEIDLFKGHLLGPAQEYNQTQRKKWVGSPPQVVPNRKYLYQNIKSPLLILWNLNSKLCHIGYWRVFTWNNIFSSETNYQNESEGIHKLSATAKSLLHIYLPYCVPKVDFSAKLTTLLVFFWREDIIKLFLTCINIHVKDRQVKMETCCANC